MFKKRHPLYVQMWKRGLRSFYLRHFDPNAKSPRMVGRIVCHLIDTNASNSPLGQIDYLREREVKTFRIYSDRPKEISTLLSSYERFSQLSCSVIGLTTKTDSERIWKLIDNYNFSLPMDYWSLALRTGEYLQYPHFETRTLPDLCQFLFDEHRRSLFSVALDLYPEKPGKLTSLEYGRRGWVIDRFGYNFAFDKSLQVDRWHGGFLYRFPEHRKAFPRIDLSRVPLIRGGYRTIHTKNLDLGLPSRINLANCPHHLSPTGCIVSDNAFRFWTSRYPEHLRPEANKQLLAAPQLSINWNHEELIANGFMNPGQWL